MTQEEFEARIGHQVAAEEFDAFNEVYMNCKMGKDAFCKAVLCDPKDHDLTRKLIFDLSAGVSHYKTSRNDILEYDKQTGEDLARKAHDYDDDGLRGMAKKLLGQRDYIVYCISNGLDLDNYDRNYIIEHLRED